MLIVSPVICLAASDARNTEMAPMSAGVEIDFTGILF